VNQIERRLRSTTDRLANAKEGRDAAIRDAAQRGWSHRRIAEVTGLSHQRVGQIIRQD
jgi:hypothetical protein